MPRFVFHQYIYIDLNRLNFLIDEVPDKTDRVLDLGIMPRLLHFLENDAPHNFQNIQVRENAYKCNRQKLCMINFSMKRVGF